MKKLSIALGTAAAVTVANGALSGGYETNALSTSFMYEEVGENKGFASVIPLEGNTVLHKQFWPQILRPRSGTARSFWT